MSSKNQGLNKAVQNPWEEWNLLVKYMSSIWISEAVLSFYGISSFFRTYDLKVLNTLSHNPTELWTLKWFIMVLTKSIAAQNVKNLHSFYQLRKDASTHRTSLFFTCLRIVDELCCFLYFVLICKNIKYINLRVVMEYIDFILLNHKVYVFCSMWDCELCTHF